MLFLPSERIFKFSKMKGQNQSIKQSQCIIIDLKPVYFLSPDLQDENRTIGKLSVIAFFFGFQKPLKLLNSFSKISHVFQKRLTVDNQNSSILPLALPFISRVQKKDINVFSLSIHAVCLKM